MKKRIARWLAILACGYALTSFAQSRELSLKKYARDVEGLQKLTEKSASKQTDSGIDLAALVSRSAHESDQVQTYGSYVQLRFKAMKELASHDYVRASWQFDYVHPDRYHVVQLAWSRGPRYDYDEWITIGTDDFDFLALGWVGGPHYHEERVKLSRKLGMDKYIDVLTKLVASQSVPYRYRGRRYLRLEYVLADAGDFAFGDGTAQPGQLILWIDSDSGRLAKAQTIVTARISSETLSYEFEQGFVQYAGELRIEKPDNVIMGK